MASCICFFRCCCVAAGNIYIHYLATGPYATILYDGGYDYVCVMSDYVYIFFDYTYTVCMLCSDLLLTEQVLLFLFV
jgi:hypothetical protein